MHVKLFLVRKFQLCANAVMPCKLRVGLKYLQLCAGLHFNSQNTHMHFRNSHFTRGRPPLAANGSGPLKNNYRSACWPHDVTGHHRTL